jgi:hypothetical protein
MGKTKALLAKEDDMPEDVTSEELKELHEAMKQLILQQRSNRQNKLDQDPTTQDMKDPTTREMTDVAKKYLTLEKLKGQRTNGRFLMEFEDGLETLVQEFTL